MAFGKKNRVSLNPLDYNIMLLGSPKVGKTTLAYEVCEKLVGEDGYMLVEIGEERGADAIEGAMYINTPSWHGEYDELTNSVGLLDLCDDIIENKTTEYPNLKVLVFDTFDNEIKIAEAEAIRLWNRKCKTDGHSEKCTDSINAIYGGYGRGEKKAMELMNELRARLNSVGVKVFTIGHIKNKDINDVVTGDSYQILTSDSQSNYFNDIKKSLHFLALAYVDRNIVKEKTGKKNNKGDDIIVGRVTAESRKIKFRDDGFAVDSGSRFADIVDEVPMDSDAFIKAMTDAIEIESKKSGRSLADTKKEQEKLEKKKQERVVEAEKTAKAEHELADIIDEIMNFFQDNRANIDTVKPIMTKIKNMGYDKPQSIDNLDDAKEILALCI